MTRRRERTARAADPFARSVVRSTRTTAGRVPSDNVALSTDEERARRLWSMVRNVLHAFLLLIGPSRRFVQRLRPTTCR